LSRYSIRNTAPEPVCVCNNQYYGGDCNKTSERWAELIDEDRHTRNSRGNSGTKGMWWYLETAPYKLRYALTALVIELANCHHVLEIGGWKTPIDEFFSATSSILTSTTVDPIAEPYYIDNFRGRTGQTLRLRTQVQEYKLRGDEDAIVYLGVSPEWATILEDFPRILDSVKVVALEGAEFFGALQKIKDIATKLLIPKGFTETVHQRFNFGPMRRGDEQVSDVPDESIPSNSNNHNRMVYIFTRNVLAIQSREYVARAFSRLSSMQASKSSETIDA